MIVADAGPVIALARVGQLALLQQVVTALVVPEAVYEDLVIKGRGKPGARAVEQSAWMACQAIQNRDALAHFPRGLGQGEREAIVLAAEERALLLADDQKAREEAAHRGIEVIGILWVLSQAKQRTLIPAVRPLIAELQAIGYWLHNDVVQPFLKALGEAD